MRAIAATLMVLALTISGCASSDSADGATGSTDDEVPNTTDPGNNETPTPTPTPGGVNGTTENSAPVLNFTATAVQGMVPLTVTFTVDGSDADGDMLNWTIDVQSDGSSETTGTELPADYSYTYEEVGIFVAHAYLDDQNGSIVAANITITVTDEPSAPAWGGMDEKLTVAKDCAECSFSGPWTSVGLNAGVQGIDIAWIAIPAEAIGRDFTVTSNGALGDPDILFGTKCSFDYSTTQSFYTGGGESGKVPAGSKCLFVWEALAAANTEIHLIVKGD